MEQQFNIKSTYSKVSIIQNLPIQFSIDDRRSISFTCPTVKEVISDLELRTFITLLKLDESALKKSGVKFSFDMSTTGKIIQGLLKLTDYTKVISKFLVRYIKDSEYVDYSIKVDNETIMSYEYDYIAKVILISLMQKDFEEEEKEEEEKEPINPHIAEILKAQKEAEEKLKKAKQKKNAKQGGVPLEEILLATSYEFGFSIEHLMNITYFGVAWYFGFVGKVDAHKLNQMILSSGMSKQKKYSYWLNK